MIKSLGLVALLAGFWLVAGAPAQAAETCAPEGRVHYLCGPKNVEDMVLVKGTRWIIASGMTGPNAPVGQLYLIDSRAHTWKPLTPDVSGPAQSPYGACPGAPDLARLAPHGVALRQDKGARPTLYVVNHGGREAIEMFAVDGSASGPALRWIGCAVLPAGASGNAVAPLPGGGFVATRFQTAGDAKAFDKMADLVKDGLLYAWGPKTGFTTVPGSEMSGANGVEATADGKWLFANAWPEQRVIRFQPGSSAPPQSVKLDFLPDNIRWGQDGQLLVAGQASDIKTLLKPCPNASCPHGWTVVRLDPVSLKVTPALHAEGTGVFSDATVGIQVGHELWVGTYRGDRVANAVLP